jgi:cation:H+ antiporter
MSQTEMNISTSILFLIGFVVLIVGGELLVRGASRLAAAAGIPPLVVGLTVVAFGTSSPEIAVMAQAAFGGQSELIIGNVVGSNIANVLLILGLSAMAAPLIVPRRLIRLEVPLMILVSFVMLLMALDGRVSRLEGVVLCAGFLAHMLFMLHEQRGTMNVSPSEEEPDRAYRGNWKEWARNILLVFAGLALLLFGSNWLVDGAVALARALGVSELILGLTIIAIGTSLPELTTSIIAGLRGARDIAVGNIIGSNIFNILAGLGLTALIAPSGVQVSQAALRFDIPVMIASAVACLPIFHIGHRISRWEGGLFFGYYIAYTTYLILTATRHHMTSQFRVVMLWFVIPLTVVTILIFIYRTARADKSKAESAPGASQAS